jgi:hypothetical protein
MRLATLVARAATGALLSSYEAAADNVEGKSIEPQIMLNG